MRCDALEVVLPPGTTAEWPAVVDGWLCDPFEEGREKQNNNKRFTVSVIRTFGLSPRSVHYYGNSQL